EPRSHLMNASMSLDRILPRWKSRDICANFCETVRFGHHMSTMIRVSRTRIAYGACRRSMGRFVARCVMLAKLSKLKVVAPQTIRSCLLIQAKFCRVETFTEPRSRWFLITPEWL